MVVVWKFKCSYKLTKPGGGALEGRGQKPRPLLSNNIFVRHRLFTKCIFNVSVMI